MNPFRYGCVVGGENFCPRPELQRQLKELLKGGQNVVMQGPRRMGKTSLVCETVRSVRGMRLLYADLFCVRTIGEFCRRMVAAAAKCGSGRSFLDRVVEMVRGLRPVFTVDRDTGAPTITVDVREAKGVESVEEVFAMIGKIAERTNLCVVLDEFQDVQDLPDSDVVLSRLRAMIQFMPDVPFVFLGSVRNSMREIFDSPRSPFFKSAISFDVDRISKDDFAAFLVDRFNVGNRVMPKDVAKFLIDQADGISGDVQELSETTWLSTAEGEKITEASVKKGLVSVFARERQSFSQMKSRLTTVQLSVLTGLSKEDDAKVFSGDFMSRYGIRNVGSVTKAIKQLKKEEYIFEYESHYRFENPFFKMWLADEF